MTRDGVAGLICLALSIGMLVLTRGLPHSPFVPIGPDFYPRIVLIIMAVLSAMLVGFDLWRARAAAAPTAAAVGAQTAPEERNYRLVGITFGLFAGYVVLLSLTGYRIATFIFMVALQWVLDRPQTRRRWIVLLVSALATTAVTYVIFDVYLSVLLPRGSWTGW